jgi:putative tryptophan/tyrosine transport system substrate-binding protein
MGKKATFVLLLGLALATVHPAEAQQPKKFFRIGYLSNTDEATESTRSVGVRQALRELGYVEGQNMSIEYRYGEGKRDRAPAILAELTQLKVDIIVVGGGASWVRAAKNATKIIPIVMTGPGDDPVASGLVESLASPGGNVTGVTILTRDLGGKRLELLKEAIPKLARVAVFYEPTSANDVLDVKENLPVTARVLKVALQPWEVRAADDFERIFAAMGKERPDALYVTGAGSVLGPNQTRITAFTLKSRLPSMYYNRYPVEAGGLMSYGADQEERYRRIAYFVDRILKGTKPADMPVEQPTKFELVINLKTAKQIGLTIPPNVLARADRVIK